MSKQTTIQDTEQAWDEGALGNEEKFVRRATPQREQEVFDAMKMISIRLPNNLIDEFKKLAKLRGMRYQTLMRVILAGYIGRYKK